MMKKMIDNSIISDDYIAKSSVQDLDKSEAGENDLETMLKIINPKIKTE